MPRTCAEGPHCSRRARADRARRAQSAGRRRSRLTHTGDKPEKADAPVCYFTLRDGGHGHTNSRRARGAARAGGSLRPRGHRPPAGSGAHPARGGGRRRLGRRAPRQEDQARAGKGRARARRAARGRCRRLAPHRRRRARRDGDLPCPPAEHPPQPAPGRGLPGGHQRQPAARPADVQDAEQQEGAHLDRGGGRGRSRALPARARRHQGLLPPHPLRAGRLAPRDRDGPARVRRLGQADRRAPTTPPTSPARRSGRSTPSTSTGPTSSATAWVAGWRSRPA